jgi:hypothetical protein
MIGYAATAIISFVLGAAARPGIDRSWDRVLEERKLRRAQQCAQAWGCTVEQALEFLTQQEAQAQAQAQAPPQPSLNAVVTPIQDKPPQQAPQKENQEMLVVNKDQLEELVLQGVLEATKQLREADNAGGANESPH